MNILGRIFHILRRDITTRGFNISQREYSFKSAFALENLYPKSNVKLYHPEFKNEHPKVEFTGFIPMDKLTVTYSRSSGPGGQHVNTVNTKVDLRFEVKSADWISQDIREKLLEKNRINKEGFLVIKSDLTRSQQMNLADALERLRVMIRKTLIVAPEISPQTQEKIRKAQMKAARERLFVKRSRSLIKQSRRLED
ncbi:peptidyl-tRNA hydrolase ICT1, mitochondrial isoform X2 [Diachasma alloeum]|uniref:peptidyl-tRNA hydrolase ICT1, mitochondrial isoform X2 n=1 Tax=Diachasma alloeum TaxID=454923 RepID=UPI0007383B8E|nr:peptidyl-tRNA hydrolase ICT1, mitochondrial isoform X2 [Diachasma alloeum]